MGNCGNDVARGWTLTRRDVFRAGAGAAALGGVAARHGASAAGVPGRGAVARAQDGDSTVFLSNQLTPVAEAEAMRNTILADFEGEVEFIAEDAGPFVDRVRAEAEAGQGTVSVLGGLHGDLALFAADGLLADLTDLGTELGDRGFLAEYLELARLGGQQLNYIPWMQASYIMAARREALEYLPEGVDEQALQTTLTYDQVLAWARNINEAEGPRFGLPASDDGLINRFLQGYAYPSFTGGVNTTFRSEAAVSMWQWLKDIWQYADPQSVTYANMSEPMLSTSVWLTWDHTARLINALREVPDDFITFPAPRGPEGLGFMPVLAGLAIPKTAPDQAAARALIEYLTRPDVQQLTLREVAFFPTIEAELPEDLPAGIQQEADAVQATTSSEAALPSLLPVGLGGQSDAYNEVFRNAFRSIVLEDNEIQGVLDAEAQNLQRVLDAAQASCWAPDPESDGVCQVG